MKNIETVLQDLKLMHITRLELGVGFDTNLDRLSEDGTKRVKTAKKDFEDAVKAAITKLDKELDDVLVVEGLSISESTIEAIHAKLSVDVLDGIDLNEPIDIPSVYEKCSCTICLLLTSLIKDEKPSLMALLTVPPKEVLVYVIDSINNKDLTIKQGQVIVKRLLEIYKKGSD